MADVKITLKKSLIGCKKPDNAQTEGKIKKIIHLVEVIKG